MAGNAADDVKARLRAIKERATTTAPRAAVTAMAHLGVAATMVQLSRTSHGAGTPTPAPPGSPPSWVSGSLARSIIATPAVVAAGKATSSVGPTIVYGRIQELGGTISPRGGGMLAWHGPDGMRFARKVTLPARPYLRPTTESLVASGKLGEVAAQAFTAAIVGA